MRISGEVSLRNELHAPAAASPVVFARSLPFGLVIEPCSSLALPKRTKRIFRRRSFPA